MADRGSAISLPGGTSLLIARTMFTYAPQRHRLPLIRSLISPGVSGGASAGGPGSAGHRARLAVDGARDTGCVCAVHNREHVPGPRWVTPRLRISPQRAPATDVAS